MTETNIAKLIPETDQEKLSLAKNQFGKDLSAAEFAVFGAVAKELDLSIINKEIIAVKFRGTVAYVVTIGALRKKANESGAYMGCDVSVVMDEKGQMPLSAQCVIKKMVQGHICEFKSEVIFKEYTTGQNLWKSKPVTMIKKVAEAHAHRMAFTGTHNLYVAEEIDRSRGVYDNERTVSLTERFSGTPELDAPSFNEVELATVDTSVDTSEQ